MATLDPLWTHDSFPSSLDTTKNHASFVIWRVAASTIELDRHYLTGVDGDLMARRNVFLIHYDENDNDHRISGKRKMVENHINFGTIFKSLFFSVNLFTFIYWNLKHQMHKKNCPHNSYNTVNEQWSLNRIESNRVSFRNSRWFEFEMGKRFSIY